MVTLFGFIRVPLYNVRSLFCLSVRPSKSVTSHLSRHTWQIGTPSRHQFCPLYANSISLMSASGFSGNKNYDGGSEGQPSVADLRVAYSNEALQDDKTGDDPIKFFGKWIDQAVNAEEPEPNAMCLSTVDESNRPSARYVLLKGYDERGFVWYTNYKSRKAENLQSNEYAALTFWWPTLQRSVRIEGQTSKIDAIESDAYFASRPAPSRLGAWASDQSRPIDNVDVLHQRWHQLQSEYLDSTGNLIKEIERPSHWGGYRLQPHRIEFWKGRPARLHDRIVFERKLGSDCESRWTKLRLQP